MSDPNLTGALQGSLDAINQNPDSPLAEATTDSVDILLDRINTAFAEGLPEKLTDSTLRQVINVYRAQALHWVQEEEIKKNKAPRARKSLADAITIDLLSE